VVTRAPGEAASLGSTLLILDKFLSIQNGKKSTACENVVEYRMKEEVQNSEEVV
jgi:hypothetical protein